MPRFVFSFRNHNNCFSITQQLYLDFKDLGIEEMFALKEGYSSMPQVDGAPIGLHWWLELDGWVIDASGGAFGNPVLFQNAENYYARRMMPDIKDARGDAPR